MVKPHGLRDAYLDGLAVAKTIDLDQRGAASLAFLALTLIIGEEGGPSFGFQSLDDTKTCCCYALKSPDLCRCARGFAGFELVS